MHTSPHRGALSASGRNLLGASAIVLAFAATSVHAQSAGPAPAPAADPAAAAPGSDVVVTASRRGATNVQSVPEAVDAYSGRTLERLNVQSLQDLSKIDPSLSIQNFGVNQQQVIIRGISSTTGQTAGIYVDEAPLEGGFNANLYGDNTPGLRLHDIDHVEVLKGPQGTLFGAGSMSGTVRVITNQPQLETYGGSVDARLATIDGGSGYLDGDAAVNIPVVKDVFGVRAVVWGENGGGFIDQTIGNTTRNNVNDEHLYGGRFEALFKPTDRLSLLATFNYQNSRVDGTQAWTQYVGPLSAPGGPELGPFPAYQNHSPSQEPYGSQYYLATVTGRYDLGFGSIVATSSYGNKDELTIADTTPSDCSYGLCAGSPAYPAAFSAHAQFHDYTDELRFSSAFNGPFQMVAGVYFEQDNLLYDGAVLHANPFTGVLPCNTYAQCHTDGLAQPGFGVSPVEFANQDHFVANEYAVYAQGDYKILPTLTATIGARYFVADLRDEQTTQENIAPATTPYGFDGGYVLGDITTPYVSSRNGSHESEPTYNFALLWKATNDVSLYVRAASGFRIGGINEAATVAAQEGIAVPSSYAPDSLWDYEGGIKAYFLERRLFVDLSVYHIDWSGEQEDALAGGVYNYTLNVGKSTINGVELSSTVRPIEGLSLSGSVTYVNAVLASNLPATVVDAGTPGRKGDRSPFVPEWTASGQAEYDHPVFGDYTGYGQASFTYRSDEFTALEPSVAPVPQDYYTELKPYFLLDLKAGLRFDRYDLALYATNVTNAVAEVGARAALDAIRIFPARPRTVGIAVSAHF